MLKEWIEKTTHLLSSLEIEARASAYVANNRASLKKRQSQIMLELADCRENTAEQFLALPDHQKPLFVLCKLAATVHAESCVDKVEDIEPLQQGSQQRFGTRDVFGSWAKLQSKDLRLLSAAESLGRLNGANGRAGTSLMFEALLLRIKSETLYPKLMQALYQTFWSSASLLTPEETRQAVKRQIYQYFIDNPVEHFTYAPLEYKDLNELVLDNPSVLSLFNTRAPQDRRLYEGLIHVVKRHPILRQLNLNTELPAQTSVEQISTYLDIFGVLAHSPYSSNRMCVDGHLTEAPELTPTPATEQKLRSMTLGCYQHYKNVYSAIKHMLLCLPVSLSEKDRRLLHSLLQQYTGNTVAKIFDVLFSSITMGEEKNQCRYMLQQAKSDFEAEFSCYYSSKPFSLAWGSNRNARLDESMAKVLMAVETLLQAKLTPPSAPLKHTLVAMGEKQVGHDQSFTMPRLIEPNDKSHRQKLIGI